MRIVTARRIAQVFFFFLFLWFCLAANPGEKWWQLRGWPVNWFLQLDPLLALGTLLSTGALYRGLVWAVVTVVLTLILGRWFCGWLCPLGSLQQLVGHLAARDREVAERARRRRYHPGQKIKYVLLFFLLGVGAWELIALTGWFWAELSGGTAAILAVAGLGVFIFPLTWRRRFRKRHRGLSRLMLALGLWVVGGALLESSLLLDASLQVGLLDPIALMHRSVNLVLLPLADSGVHRLSPAQRYTVAAWGIGAVFLTVLLMCLFTPRFYCRFVCPLGALFGLLGRFSLWRIGRTGDDCEQCARCEAACEGACNPSGAIRINECVLCMNCRVLCKDGRIRYRVAPSESGEIAGPDLSRRGVTLSVLSGVMAVPVIRLGGALGANWSPRLIRPPGALTEAAFLQRCIKCGQCMRLCPTNIIHPASLEGGLEGFWTPVLNFRIGTSGCQVNCVACGQVCPTAAIRPITLDEKRGKGDFEEAGPIRLGTAFVDRGRCLPWAMGKPCIVCEENCPVSPKAIVTRQVYESVAAGPWVVDAVEDRRIVMAGPPLTPGAFGTGDFVLAPVDDGQVLWPISGNDGRGIILQDIPSHLSPAVGVQVAVRIRLKRPYIVPERCIGCGICEHECPVRGRRAVRVTAENESRNRDHALLARRGVK